MPNTQIAKIQELLTRGVEQIITKPELEQALASGRKLKIYLGVDPSGPVIHLGHAVVLRRLREFQKLGHKIILLIGDFTGRVGDPSDRKAERRPLTHQEVLANAKDYKKQAARILDFSGKNPAVIKFNSKWLDKLTFKEVIELATNFTVQQMLERDMFAERLEKGKPIALHEFLYPLMQGYDSVAMDVDMEVGGSDQLFNMLAGRTLMQNLKKKNKIVMTFELLEGTDGRKMSKSFNNMIGVMDAPAEMYGKIMSLRDELIIRYLRLGTDVPLEEIKEMGQELKSGKVNPRDLKMRLAREIVTMYHSKKAAKVAEKEFIKIFRQREMPGKVKSLKLKVKSGDILSLLTKTGLAASKSQARRLIEQKGVKVDGRVVTSERQIVELAKSGVLLQKGKRHFVRVLGS